MTKSELIDLVVENVEEELTKKAVEAVIDTTFEQMKEAIIDDERFSYPGFGTFNVKERAARKGRNPRTGEEIEIAASRTVGFKPAPRFKDSL